MTKTDLFELLAGGGNSGVEFKSDVVDNCALAKELVALANLHGGQLLLGVDDDGRVLGLARKDPPAQQEDGAMALRTYRRLEEWVMQACRDKIRPEIVPYFQVLRDVSPGRDVAAVHVSRGWNVHHVWHKQHRTCYVRVGSLSREASPEELARLFHQREAVRPELQPVSGSSIAALDGRRLADYFERVRDQALPAADRENEWETLLVHTGFLHEDDPHPATMAGLLLFCANVTRFLPQAKIDAAAYFGAEKDYGARERRTLRGPIAPLVGASGALLEPGLVEQAIEFVRRNIETVRLQNGVRREERWDYPADAVREAIVNAVAHRDYLLSGADIEIAIYSDRLEVVSPGRLASGITPDRMRAGCRSARNELLNDAIRDYGYLGTHGHGGTAKDRARHARAQRHGAGSRRGRRAVHGTVVERGAREPGEPALIVRYSRAPNHRHGTQANRLVLPSFGNYIRKCQRRVELRPPRHYTVIHEPQAIRAGPLLPRRGQPPGALPHVPGRRRR